MCEKSIREERRGGGQEVRVNSIHHGREYGCLRPFCGAMEVCESHKYAINQLRWLKGYMAQLRWHEVKDAGFRNSLDHNWHQYTTWKHI